MTIKNLYKLLKQETRKVIVKHKITDFHHQRLAFDASNTIYKLVLAFRFHGKDLKNKGLIVTHLDTLLKRVIALLKYKIKPVFVFDGKPSSLKAKVIHEREAQKEKGKKKYLMAENDEEKQKYYHFHQGLTHQEMNDCKLLLQCLGIPVINSPEEADSQCAYLSREGLVDGVVSDDIDILLFGSENIIKDFSTSEAKDIIVVRRKRILKELDITQKQLIEAGIMLGCDYCKKMKGVGQKTVVPKIKKYGSIRHILEEEKEGNKKFAKCYRSIRKYFFNAPVMETSKKDVKLQGFSPNKLIKFLREKKFDESYITKKLKELRQVYLSI